MKTLIAIASIGLITALLTNNLSWWWCGVIAFLVAFAMRLTSAQAFLAGFFGVALAWGIMNGWMDAQGGGLLSKKIGELFGGISSWILIAISSLLGGLVGALGGMTGGALGRQFEKKEVGEPLKTRS